MVNGKALPLTLPNPEELLREPKPNREFVVAGNQISSFRTGFADSSITGNFEDSH